MFGIDRKHFQFHIVSEPFLVFLRLTLEPPNRCIGHELCSGHAKVNSYLPGARRYDFGRENLSGRRLEDLSQ